MLANRSFLRIVAVFLGVALSAVFLSTASMVSYAADKKPQRLRDARKGHETKLLKTQRSQEKIATPPKKLFRIVRYKSKVGRLSAYVSEPESRDKKYPAIIWLSGGFPVGGCHAGAWIPQGRDNDQSASSYRRAGIIMMYPSLRGTYGNPGRQEYFYGEVEDVLAAGTYLKSLDYVDPKRVYLGGHSTGGTLALLAATATTRFRAIFSFGPVSSASDYGDERALFDIDDAKESRLRSPIHFLDAIRTPTFVIEGSERGNAASLRELRAATKNPRLRCIELQGADHFNLMAPINDLIASKIVALESDKRFRLSTTEVHEAFQGEGGLRREVSDLETLAEVRGEGHRLDRPVVVTYYLYAPARPFLLQVVGGAKKAGFKPLDIVQRKTKDGEIVYLLPMTTELTLGDLAKLFATSKEVVRLAESIKDVGYGGWGVD
ncbi:MAG: alpha/beta fold hydrolase [Planctomycetota bacterium]